MKPLFLKLFSLAAVLALAAPYGANAATQPATPIPSASTAPVAPAAQQATVVKSAPASHRLIVKLKSLPVVAFAARAATKAPLGASDGGRPDLNAPQVQTYINQIKAEQAAFIGTMNVALPSARVAQYINEQGQSIAAVYQVVFNGMAVDPGLMSQKDAITTLRRLPGVAAVYPDNAHDPDMYASLPLIDAQAAWNNSAIGGQQNAGAGVKFASMDGGVHHSAAMFSGVGYSYPDGWPSTGKGLTSNNNGKIILSRAYFRPWDPPSLGDENPWPGTQGTPHGTHTSSTAVGEEVVADYRGVTVTLSGVAPKAWVMSYRVFYNSITNNGSFYDAEGLAALEDIARDGADVLNNSWGSGALSIGGAFDPIDEAIINVSRAGTFVSVSNGNSGPNLSTGDHSSSEYINVAASTTSGTFGSGRVSVSAPAPLSPTLQNIAFETAYFGSVLPPNAVFTYSLLPAESISLTNVNGCNPWDPGTFTGKAALIQRGACDFSLKVLNAELGGAAIVIVYNSVEGGDTLIPMAPGASDDQVTIPSIFIYRSKGLAMQNWYNLYGSASVVSFDTTIYQVGNTPDIIASFSSRGPGVGNVLKPDIAAPGVNILAQGYGDAAGEASALGFGQVSGTSMASPHVAGAAVLMRQIHPEWSNADIKSALMSTSKYIGIYNDAEQTIPAQPLDMGAGRLDLTHAADPGVILDPPSLSFGLVPTGTTKSVSFSVRNITTATEVYTLTTLYTGDGFPGTEGLAGFSLSANVITLTAGSYTAVTAWFSSTLGNGLGDNQGYVVLAGRKHNAHLPAWARVTYQPEAQILIIKNDGENSVGYPGYLGYYTSVLDNLGYTYTVLDVDSLAGTVSNFLNITDLLNYKAIIYYTGDNYDPNGTYEVPTPLTSADMDTLVAYADNGGAIIAMGQDMAAVLNSTISTNWYPFYNDVLGGLFWRDSVSNNLIPPLPIGPTSGAAPAFKAIHLDLSAVSAYETGATDLSVALPNLAPITPDTLSAQFNGTYGIASGVLSYTIAISDVAPYTLTAIHIHSGTLPALGDVMYPLLDTTTPVLTNQHTISGKVLINSADVDQLLSGGTYINIHVAGAPPVEMNGQLVFTPNKDGATNQTYVDEIGTIPNVYDLTGLRYTPILKYPGSGAIEDNVVSMAHRDQPTLENPGISYLGRSVYASFGLEGVNNSAGFTSRKDLLKTFLNYVWDQPTSSIARTTVLSNSSNLEQFTASYGSNIVGATAVTYRWDYGDGTAYTSSGYSPTTIHTYQYCGPYTVRVEIADSYGNHTIGTQQVNVTKCTVYRVFLYFVVK